ncbi:hypothetical protein O6H91_Y373100 [Diphasiastrum complanatum]|nr:hypothetical protein O6H91_Y373100 [Diphasiastrum complanatum]KAJ7279871.1 hypothetical protein O6H91_Y373100 [Diphasiastrum complanatum]KAJ7279872.1 hypothetical protein O6H91_Y373100 [Diphasiastrum complanatum]
MMCEVTESSRSFTASQKKEAMFPQQESSSASDGTSLSQVLQRRICSSLLELAAENDLNGFSRVVEEGAALDEPDSWYGRVIGSTYQMATEQRTAMMIASLYGSVEVLTYILCHLPFPITVVNKAWGPGKVTALHCAAAGGSVRAAEIIRLLLDHGAYANVKDVHGRQPVDMLVVSPMFLPMKASLEEMLNSWRINGQQSPVHSRNERSEIRNCASKVCLLFLPNPLSVSEHKCLDDFVPEPVDKTYNTTSTYLSLSSPDSSPLVSPPSPSSPKSSEDHSPKSSGEGTEKAREYPVDASLPDIKNILYTTDEFRMFSFKVRPCSRAYSHDWTECPFVHPGENARRRDPRRYHYSCVPCPDFRKGTCRRGDACEYAHGVFECWLHPAQYRTRLCKDGTNCARRVCFFAHTTEELRPLYVSMGSAVPSPRASSSLDTKSMSPPFPPVSPLQVLMVPQYSPSNPPGSTPPLSPASSLHSSVGGGWSQPNNIPSLHLPGGSLHVSRLKEALNARDVALEDLDDSSNLDSCSTSEFKSWSTCNRSSPTVAAGSIGRKIGKYENLGLSISPPNLQDMFASETSSTSSMSYHNCVKEQSYLSPRIQSHLQSHSHIDSLLSPRSSQKLSISMPQPLAHFNLPSLGSPRSISTRGTDLDLRTSPPVPLSSDAAASLCSRKAAFVLRGRESWSSKDLSGSVSLPSWSDWGSPSGKPDWGVRGQDLGKFKRSASLSSHGPTDLDIFWVQTLMKDGSSDREVNGLNASNATAGAPKGPRENMEHLLCSWMDQIPPDKMVA